MANADAANSGNSGGLAALMHEAGPRVLAAIKHASAATGVDFSYMIEKASAESGLNSKAKSASSSATGLYQFIDSTWMDMVKKYGAKCGLGDLAASIDGNGQVANKATRQEILNLRKDPDTAAMMAAEYTSENKTAMQTQLGPSAQIGPTELYLAHFMGAGGATNFMKAYQSNPLQAASTVCGKAASANHNVFYDHSGKARSLAAVYDMFAKKFGTDATPCGNGGAGTAQAAASETGGGVNETSMAALLLAQGDRGDAGTAGSVDETTLLAAANAPVAAMPAGMETVSASATDASIPGAAVSDTTAPGEATPGIATPGAIRWFSPRLSIARLETNSQLGAMEATTARLRASFASDPAHLALLRQHHGETQNRALARSAYHGAAT